MKIELPDLPYAETALEPHISAETLQYHHGKHHAKYVATVKELIDGTEMGLEPLEVIIQRTSGKLLNNAAQVWNHTFYWNCLAPDAGGVPADPLAAAIEEQFGSFEQFKEQFTDEATSLFGSGWVWLVRDADGSLVIQQGPNAETPIRHGATPILTCDVWEHAYYIDYRNARAQYLDAFWNLVNWDFAAEQYDRWMQRLPQSVKSQPPA